MGVLEILGIVSLVATLVGPVLARFEKTRKVGHIVSSVGYDLGKATRAAKGRIP